MNMRHLCAFVIAIAVSAGVIIATAAGAGPPAADRTAWLHPTGANLTCAHPTLFTSADCRRIEERILKSTVRIKIETWVVAPGESGYLIDSSVGHATLKDGRYLVTHNHFSVSLSIRPHKGEPEAFGIVTLSNSQGEACYKGPLSDFELVWDDPQTLVIAHKEDGFFEELGFASAGFDDWSSLPLAAGMEVAHVDWDGETTHVDWVTIKEVTVDDQVPCLILNGDVTRGASGGGVFWQGAHIANNWCLLQNFDEAGALVNVTTKAALNSAHVTGLMQLPPSG